MSSARDRKRLHDSVIAPYERRGRMVTPSATSWSALGRVLSTLAERDGLILSQTPRSFTFDILIAQSCREVGAVLISRNLRDLDRIATVAPFDFVAPYLDLGYFHTAHDAVRPLGKTTWFPPDSRATLRVPPGRRLGSHPTPGRRCASPLHCP